MVKSRRVRMPLGVFGNEERDRELAELAESKRTDPRYYEKGTHNAIVDCNQFRNTEVSA